jgi:hypothetical protein
MNFMTQDKYGFTAENFASNLRHTAKTVDFGPDTGNIRLDPKRTFAGNLRAGAVFAGSGGRHPGRNKQ